MLAEGAWLDHGGLNLKVPCITFCPEVIRGRIEIIVADYVKGH